MPEPEKNDQSKTKDSLLKKIKEDERFQKGVSFLVDWRIQLISGALMLVGIVLSFFYIHLGGMLVGLGVGICFFEEIYNYFFQLRNLYIEHGLFKSLMLIGTILYFLISVPAFIIASAIGFGIIFLIRWSLNRYK